MDATDALMASLERLQRTYDQKYQELLERGKGLACEQHASMGCPPEEFTDTDGHPLLAPLLIALVNGYAALSAAERSSRQ